MNIYTVMTTWMAGFPVQTLYINGEVTHINGCEFKNYKYNDVYERTVEVINTNEVKNTVTSLTLIKVLKENAKCFKKHNK